MCGAAAITAKGLDYFLAKMMAEKAFEEWRDKWNLRPSQHAPIIFNKEGKNVAELASFGLIPPWSKDKNMAFSTINARLETIEQKPTYSNPFKTQRCILPAQGYYEWINAGTVKIPYYHHLKDDKPMAMACIWDENTVAEDKSILSFSIITTHPGSKLTRIHDRKPVLLREENIEAWLNPEINEVDSLKKLLHSISESEIDFYRVSSAVNSSRSEGPELIKPIN